MKNMKTFKVEYISDKESIFFEKGKIYNAFLPLDNESGNIFAFYLEDMDEPGYYGLPSNRFRKIEN